MTDPVRTTPEAGDAGAPPATPARLVADAAANPKSKPRPAAQRGPRPPAGIAVPAMALAAFFGTFSLMSLRMGAGEDPALGAGKPSAPAQQPKRVLVRRIVKKTVILPPREQALAAGGGGASAGAAPAATGGPPVSAGGGGSAGAGSTGGGGSSSGGGRGGAAPAAASSPAPAPAPAPAPVTSAS